MTQGHNTLSTPAANHRANASLNSSSSLTSPGCSSPRDRTARYRFLWVVTLLGLALLASMGLSLSLGSFPTSPPKVLGALVAPADSDVGFIIWELRLPRILLAVLAGAALACAGAILQGIVRNPLASPDVIGITSGAALAAVIFLAGLLGSLSINLLPLAALAGAVLATLLVVSLAWRAGLEPSRVVLVGIGLSAAMGAAHYAVDRDQRRCLGAARLRLADRQPVRRPMAGRAVAAAVAVDRPTGQSRVGSTYGCPGAG